MVKKIGIAVTAVILISAAAFIAINSMKVSKKIQPTPDEIFKREIIGTWNNIPSSVKTHITFNTNGKCTFHSESKTHGCVFQVEHRTITIALKTSKSPLEIFKRMADGKGYDLRLDVAAGIEISEINIKRGIMTGKMKGLSGTRETLPQSLKLMKVKTKEIVEEDKKN